jgi:hypothetical protein
MDQFDAFYQQLDSQALLQRHGPQLAAKAREPLQENPDARIAGVVATPDSVDYRALRDAIAKATGRPQPDGLMVRLVPRPVVEDVLAAHVPESRWKELPWQQQTVLPVVAPTRDGFRLAFFPLDATGTADASD